ncbi:MAG: carbohydrate kinase family protein [Chloroflexota bacterium]|jgi:pseudouridine kinase
MGDQVLLIGATLLDIKGQPDVGLEPGTSNPAVIRSTRGGTARNVAENLARLGASVTLLSAVGADLTGQRLLEQTAASGVNLDYVQTISTQNTGAYIALLEKDGTLSVALDDVRVMAHITPDFLHSMRALFAEADMVMMDGSLTPAALKTVVQLAEEYQTPLCADPSSARLAYKLRPYFPHLHLVVPNEVEALELCQMDLDRADPDISIKLARQLIQSGVKHAVITLSDFGLTYATSDETGTIPARYSEMVDSTGTGDAITAAIIFGMVNDLPTVESMRLGAAAAGLTLQIHDTVVPELSLDMLYDHLIV